MKKFLAIVLLITSLFFTGQVHAQRATVMPLAAGDTVTDAGTASKVITATAGYSGIVISAKATEISGTSAGTIQIQGSLDGTNYELIGTAYTVTDVASQVKTFYISGPLPVYIRVLQTGSGTMASVLSVRYVLRKYDH